MSRDRLGQRRARRDVVAVGVDRDPIQRGGLVAGQRIELLDRLDLVAEQRHAPGAVLVVAGEDVHGFATQPERAALEGGVVAAVLQLDQRLGQLVAIDLATDLQLHHHARVALDRADAVDAGDRGDDDDVVAFEQRLGRGVAHTVDLLVDLRVFFYVGVGAGDIGLRLVVVVVADEILHRVVGEEPLHLAVELGGQGLVGRQDQGGALHGLDHLGHGEGLAGPGDAQQDLVALFGPHAGHQFGDGGRLVAAGLVVRHHPELARHRPRRLLGRDEQDRGRGGAG